MHKITTPRAPQGWRPAVATRLRSALALAALGTALAAQAQAPALPAPESVTLDKLGYMEGFPPAPDLGRAGVV